MSIFSMLVPKPTFGVNLVKNDQWFWTLQVSMVIQRDTDIHLDTQKCVNLLLGQGTENGYFHTKLITLYYVILYIYEKVKKKKTITKNYLEYQNQQNYS